MLGVLVESRKARDRSMGGTVFSVGAHVVLIAAAVTATVKADDIPPVEKSVPPLVFHIVEPPSGVRELPGASAVGSARSLPLPRRLDIDINLPPVSAPTIDLVPTEPGELAAGSRDRAPSTSGSGTVHQPNTYFEWMVEVPARARNGNPSPNYPRTLRDGGIEGTVLAQFVIDTTGRVDTTSIRAIAATHALFEKSVRDALARMRFTPAESGGRKVRLVVQQSFAFRLQR